MPLHAYGPSVDDEGLLDALRQGDDVREWLAAYLRTPRSVLDWTAADAPGTVLLAAARVDCFDLLPRVFAAVEPLLADRHRAYGSVQRRPRRC